MSTTVWRWFPHGLIASMGLVFLVNVYMVYDAYRTFPGTAGTDGFDLSNEYNRVLTAAREQAALGWQVETGESAADSVVLRLTDRAGAPLTAATIDARAERPLGPLTPTTLAFRPAGDGRYRADASLKSGQWDIMLTVRADGHLYSTTRRVVMK